MLIDITNIGNSRGIRIPASILNSLNSDAFDLKVKNETIILTPVKKARDGWSNQFMNDKPKKRDENLLSGLDSDFNPEDWKW